MWAETIGGSEKNAGIDIEMDVESYEPPKGARQIHRFQP